MDNSGNSMNEYWHNSERTIQQQMNKTYIETSEKCFFLFYNISFLKGIKFNKF